MFRIKISGNFFLILRDSDQSEHIRHPRSDARYLMFNETDVNPLFRFEGIVDDIQPKLSKQEEFKYDDLKDQDGNGFDNVETLKTFLDENLGFNGAGETSALKTAQYILGWQDFSHEIETIDEEILDTDELIIDSDMSDVVDWTAVDADAFSTGSEIIVESLESYPSFSPRIEQNFNTEENEEFRVTIDVNTDGGTLQVVILEEGTSNIVYDNTFSNNSGSFENITFKFIAATDKSTVQLIMQTPASTEFIYDKVSVKRIISTAQVPNYQKVTDIAGGEIQLIIITTAY